MKEMEEFNDKTLKQVAKERQDLYREYKDETKDELGVGRSYTTDRANNGKLDGISDYDLFNFDVENLCKDDDIQSKNKIKELENKLKLTFSGLTKKEKIDYIKADEKIDNIGTHKNEYKQNYENVKNTVLNFEKKLKNIRQNRFSLIKNKGIENRDIKLKSLHNLENEIQNRLNKLALNPETKSFTRMAELENYKKQIIENRFVLTNTPKENLIWLEEQIAKGNPILLYGATETGKSELVRFASKELYDGVDPETISCTPATTLYDIYSRTGLESGNTVDKKGSYTDAVLNGKILLMDEFNNLENSMRLSFKEKYNRKSGDTVDIPNFGKAVIKDGYAFIATANLKSDKHSERNELLQEEARVFATSNKEVKYQDDYELYDILLASFINTDNTTALSYDDAENVLPNLVKAIKKIQEGYTDTLDNKYGDMGKISKKQTTLGKLVLGAGNMLNLVSGYEAYKYKMSLPEYINQNFKTVVSFKEYPENDREYVAKIMRDFGFLMNIDESEIGLKPNTLDGFGAQIFNNKINQETLLLKELTEIDPFGKNKLKEDEELDGLLGQDEKNEETETKSFSGEKSISTKFGNEQINIDIEKRVNELSEQYKELIPNFNKNKFSKQCFEIFGRNKQNIERDIREVGFNNILFTPDNLPNSQDLNDKIVALNNDWNETYLGDNFKNAGSFGSVKEPVSGFGMVLYHNVQNLADNPILNATKNESILSLTNKTQTEIDQIILKNQELDFYITIDNKKVKTSGLTISEYLVLQNDYRKNNPGKNLDEDSWSWLMSYSGSRVVGARWLPSSSSRRVDVAADDASVVDSGLGFRSSRRYK